MARKCPRGLAQCHGERVGQCFNTQTTLNRPMGSQVPTLSSEEAQCHRSRAPQCSRQSSVFTPDAAQERQCPPSSLNAADTGSSMVRPSAVAHVPLPIDILRYLGLAFSRSRRIAKALMWYWPSPMPRQAGSSMPTTPTTADATDSINDRASLLDVARTGQLNDSCDNVPRTA
ncbi:hypothetical protein EV122DRAFT_277566 [Schizophyllum commune]